MRLLHNFTKNNIIKQIYNNYTKINDYDLNDLLYYDLNTKINDYDLNDLLYYDLKSI